MLSRTVLGMDHVKAWLQELLETSVWSADISQAAFIVGASLYQLDKKSLTEIDASHYERFIAYVIIRFLTCHMCRKFYFRTF